MFYAYCDTDGVLNYIGKIENISVAKITFVAILKQFKRKRHFSVSQCLFFPSLNCLID